MPQADKTPPKRSVGRPKGAVGKVAEARKMTVREYAMTHVFEVIDMWADVMRDKKEPSGARIAAGDKIMTRAIGQAAQAQPSESDTADQPLQTIRRIIMDSKGAEIKGDVKAKA